MLSWSLAIYKAHKDKGDQQSLIQTRKSYGQGKLRKQNNTTI